MKGLIAYATPGAPASGELCAPGEWLIPNLVDQGQFLGIGSFKGCYTGVVAEGCDPDAMLDTLRKRYTGIPEKMLSDFISGTCLAAAELPLGTACSLMKDGESLNLWLLEKSEHGPVILAGFKTEKYL